MNHKVVQMLEDAGFEFTPDVMSKLPLFEKLLELERAEWNVDRDTVIDLVALIDTKFMKLEVGTYNEFDKYELFALYIAAKVIAEEREACAKLCDKIADDDGFEGGYAANCADMIRARGQE